MVARADILAGRAVILINIQDTIDKQLRGIRSKMRMFTSGISEFGGDLFRGGVASTIAAAFPVREFVTFQDQMLFLQTKVQATDEAIKPLEKTIRRLGMTTSFSSQEVAKAGTMFAQAGFSTGEIQKSLQAALDLARGSQVDLTTSTTILSNAIRTFQVDASMAAVFASKFTTAARLGTLDIVDLGESLKYSAGTFANFGLELDDVLGMITTLANSGLKASLAGTSLNTAFLNLASSAPKLKELLDVELLDADFRNPIQALRKLEAGLQKFSKIRQAGILQQLVNIRGGRAIQGLLLQGLDKVEANIAEIRKSTDEARRSAQKLDSQLGGVGRRALSAFQELNIALGQTTEGPLTKFGERLTAVFNDLSRLATVNPKVTQTLLLMAPAALAAGVGLLVMTSVVGKLAMLITPLMMINSVIFGIVANIANYNITAIKAIGNIGLLTAAGGLGSTDKKFVGKMATYAKAISKIDVQAAKKLSPGKTESKLLGLGVLSRKDTSRLAALQKTRLAQLAAIRKKAADLPVPKDKSSFMTKSRGPGLFAGLASAFKDIGLAFRGIKGISLAKFWKELDLVSGTYKAFMLLGKSIKGVFSVLRFAGRALFTLGGITNVILFLDLFGDKIPVVKNALAGLGKAFNALFSGIGETLKNLGPSFQLIGQGISEMFGGNIERGLMAIKLALGDIATVLSTGLSAAWAKAMSYIQPGIDFLKESFRVLGATFRLLVDSIATTMGGVLESGQILIAGDGTFMETLKSIFTPENRESIYAMIGGFISEIFKQLLSAIHAISKAILEIKSAFLSISGILQVASSYLLEIFASMPKMLTGMTEKQQREMFMQAMGMRNDGQASIAGAAAAGDAAGLELDSAFNRRLEALNEALDTFLGKVSNPTKTALDEMADALFPEADFKAAEAGRAAATAAARKAAMERFRPIDDAIRSIDPQSWLNSLVDGIVSQGKQKAVAAQAAQLAPISAAIGKAIVGDFASTRGNMLQMVPRMEKLQEEANGHLEEIEDGIASLNGTKSPFVFA